MRFSRLFCCPKGADFGKIRALQAKCKFTAKDLQKPGQGGGAFGIIGAERGGVAAERSALK